MSSAGEGASDPIQAHLARARVFYEITRKQSARCEERRTRLSELSKICEDLICKISAELAEKTPGEDFKPTSATTVFKEIIEELGSWGLVEVAGALEKLIPEETGTTDAESSSLAAAHQLSKITRNELAECGKMCMLLLELTEMYQGLEAKLSAISAENKHGGEENPTPFSSAIIRESMASQQQQLAWWPVVIRWLVQDAREFREEMDRGAREGWGSMEMGVLDEISRRACRSLFLFPTETTAENRVKWQGVYQMAHSIREMKFFIRVHTRLIEKKWEEISERRRICQGEVDLFRIEKQLMDVIEESMVEAHTDLLQAEGKMIEGNLTPSGLLHVQKKLAKALNMWNVNLRGRSDGTSCESLVFFENVAFAEMNEEFGPLEEIERELLDNKIRVASERVTELIDELNDELNELTF